MRSFLYGLGGRIFDIYSKEIELPKISPNWKSIFDSEDSFEVFAI